MNKPQAEGRVNHISVQYIAGEEGSTLFSNKKLNNEAQLLVYLKSFMPYFTSYLKKVILRYL